ncbi:hypothetical protein RB195_009737 [Necator americanus]|uniref:Apple domain-containing protein n=1 Tax=Necator americanus TaxID=51031 RepID=A0ABR1CUR0_NECAM
MDAKSSSLSLNRFLRRRDSVVNLCRFCPTIAATPIEHIIVAETGHSLKTAIILLLMSVSRLKILVLSIFLQRVFGNASEGFEDITSANIFSERDEFPPPSTFEDSFAASSKQQPPETAKDGHILHNYFQKKREKLDKKLNKYASPPKHLSDMISSNSGYGDPTSRRSSNVRVNRDSEEDRQVIAGIPDLNDPCFRRYANCIIVNAQPFERRSSLSLLHCKSYCIRSQTGAYSCRSFVYDNINQVCDLFAHVGDQAPARLLKFQSRDYFEPTHAYQCMNFPISSTTTTHVPTTIKTTTVALLPARPTLPVDHIVARATKVDRREDSEKIVKAKEVNELTKQNHSSATSAARSYCPSGKRISFLRTEGFELYKNDDITLPVTHVDECVVACERNIVSGQALDCRSFDYSSSSCSFSSETAVPVGNGQLKQRDDSYYYEKICVAESAVKNCSPTFTRFPQMVLVGFAEAVADAASFESCFEYCLDSHATFGFNCSSGMYFFEEAQLNCVLNSEDRHTQKDLFTEENTDIVDYFEIGCQEPRGKARMRAAKTFAWVINIECLVSNDTSVRKHSSLPRLKVAQWLLLDREWS